MSSFLRTLFASGLGLVVRFNGNIDDALQSRMVCFLIISFCIYLDSVYTRNLAKARLLSYKVHCQLYLTKTCGI